MKYQLIAIDLDGTLLDREGSVSSENRAAIERAMDAGAMVVPCTGRGWRESLMVIEQLPTSLCTGVFVTGAMVADLATGKSIDFAVVEPGLVLELIEFLRHEPEAVLLYREPELAGHDYLITGDGEVTGNTKWWFEQTRSKVAEHRQPTADDLHHVLRVGMVLVGERVWDIEKRVVEAFGGRVFMHVYSAVNMKDPKASVYIVEIFAAGVDKWRGLQFLANDRGFDERAIAAIGDQINDHAMIKQAACGVAMDNAQDEVKAVADHMTKNNNEHGVAYAIDQMLAGTW